MSAVRTEIVSFSDFEMQIRELRFEVFVGEQGVDPELEMDGLDPDCIHAVAIEDQQVIACGRMQADGHIGRIAVKGAFRRRGIGKAIMTALHQEAKNRGIAKVWLGSQVRATEFYENLGYKTEGEVFVEAGIDHIRMAMLLRES